jgi:putative ABC transport system ATP-binding protein
MKGRQASTTLGAGVEAAGTFDTDARFGGYEDLAFSAVARSLPVARAGIIALEMAMTPSQDTLARLQGVSKRYQMGAGEVRALDDVTLDIHRGEFLAVLGPSGSGKTTLLNLLGGIDTPSSGQLLADGRDIGSLPDAELTRYRRHAVGFIFQFFNLIPTLTAVENVEFAAELVESPRDPLEVLAAVGLEGRADHFPSELSGGEQQRVAIARALVTDPPLVLCDEPTGNLDEETGKRVLGLMRRLGQEQNKTFVVVSHNSVIGEMADRVVRLRDGRVAAVQVNETPAAPEELHW